MTTPQVPESPVVPTENKLNEMTSKEIITTEMTTDVEKKGKDEEDSKQRDIISFNIFSHLNNIYRTHGLMDEDFSRFLAYVKKRRKKIKSKYLHKTSKIDKRVIKVYPEEVKNKKYLELLLLDIEYCRCQYLKIKTNVNNFTCPRRGKYNYLNRLKKSAKKILFLNRIIMQKEVDETTELQIKLFITFIECSYLLERNKYTECLEKIEHFIKLTKLIKRTLVNERIEGKALQEKQKETEKGGKRKEKKETEKKGTRGGKKNISVKEEIRTLNENGQFLDVEEERKIGEMFEYYLSMVDGYNRICLYNLKKIGNKRDNDKLEEDDFSKEVKDYIREEPIHNVKHALEICVNNTETVVSIRDRKYVLTEPDMNVIKIEKIMKEMKPMITTEEIEELDIPSDLQKLNENYEIITKFLNKFEIDFVLHDYGNLFVKCFDCLSIVHKELINSTNKKSKTSADDKMVETMWNKLESHFLTEKFYIDIERVLLILLKSLCDKYEENIDTTNETIKKVETAVSNKKGKDRNKDKDKAKEKEKKGNSKKPNEKTFRFKNKQTLHGLIYAFPLLNEGIRYAEILKQNVDSLKNIENNDLMVNILQIIKNVKSLCSAFYYVLVNRNAEAHVLFDQVKTRNYVYLKFKKEQLDTPLLRVAILFNRLQDVLYLINEKYYFRHLSLYSLMLKKKVPPTKSFLYYVDNSLFTPHMNQVGLNPLYVDMTYKYHTENFLTSTMQKERGPGIRGLIKSFWKK